MTESQAIAAIGKVVARKTQYKGTDGVIVIPKYEVRDILANIDTPSSFEKFALWVIENKRSVFEEADIPKESKLEILRKFNYSSENFDIHL